VSNVTPSKSPTNRPSQAVLARNGASIAAVRPRIVGRKPPSNDGTRTCVGETETILRPCSNSMEYSRVIQSRGVARDAALFWDRGPLRRDSVISPPTRSTFAPHATSSGGSRYHRGGQSIAEGARHFPDPGIEPARHAAEKPKARPTAEFAKEFLQHHASPQRLLFASNRRPADPTRPRFLMAQWHSRIPAVSSRATATRTPFHAGVGPQYSCRRQKFGRCLNRRRCRP
jgi:hypothetical protein